MNKNLQFLWLGNPENRRCQFFLEAAQREGWPPPLVVSYEALLNERIDWETLLSKVAFLRIESPGENATVAQGLLHRGATHPHLSATMLPDVALPKGSIAGLQQQHLGFMRVLEEVEQALANFPTVRCVNSLDSIRLCFDKERCHTRLEERGVAVPAACYGIDSYSSLRKAMIEQGWTRVFIKPLHGSSASGVVAFRVQGGRLQATTSVEMQQREGRLELYNSLRLRRYDQEKKIAALIDRLAQEGILIEQWIPKASLGDAFFDLRIVVVGDQAQHTVVRQSRSPLTNLHLGNQRGSLLQLQEKIGVERWQSVQQLAESAAAALPPHHYASLDVLLSADWTRAYILEANAFGDLLPGVLHEGRNTYAAVLHHLKQASYV